MPNPINPFANGMIPVAILGSDSFDVADIDIDSLMFGPGHAVPAHKNGGHLSDVNEDGVPDLVSHYRAPMSWSTRWSTWARYDSSGRVA